MPQIFITISKTMWVKKSVLEKASEQKESRFLPGASLLFAAGIGIVGVICTRDILGIFLAIPAFLLFYVLQIFLGTRGAGDVIGASITGGFGGSNQGFDYICPSCHATQPPNPKGCVECGTQLEKESDWKWVWPENPKPSGK